MKKVIFILFLILITFPGKSQIYPGMTSDEQHWENIRKNLDSTKEYIDSTKYFAKETGKIWVKEVKQIGLKKTIQLNSNIFLPIVIFLILYLVWLKNKKK